MEKIIMQSFDGTSLNAVFKRAQTEEVKGALLLLHGCPSEKNEDGFHSEQPNINGDFKKLGGLVEYLAASGYSSLRFDFREQGENEKTITMENLTLSGMINDIESAYCELLAKTGKGKAVGVVGTSFAGGLSIKWLNSFNRRIDHLFLLAPLLDFQYTIEKTGVIEMDKNGYKRLTKNAVLELGTNGYLLSGDKKMNKTFLNETMLMNIETEIQLLNCNITIIHGTSDTVVPYQHSVNFSKKSKGNIDLINVRDAVHGFGVSGDMEWENPQTLRNHEFVYKKVIERMNDIHDREQRIKYICK